MIYLVWHTAALIVAAALGNSARSRTRTALAAEKERHALEVESVVSERARMARDLHDVVAHHVSLIAVRAESAPYQHPHLDADARAVLAAIATDARSAINELRHALTVLRRADGEDDASSDAETQRRPQPVSDDVPGLIEQARGAGQDIEVTGQWPHLPSAPGYALYRAVQEGLTNARRHAPGQAVTLTLRHTDNDAGFTMSNPTQQTNAPHQPGRGLLGMRERMTALGGTVRTETAPHQFTLRVDLPRSEQQ